MLIKAKVARLECEVDGASDLEAPFASREEAKPPHSPLAGFIKAKVARSPATKKKKKPRFSSKQPSFSYLRFSFSS